MGWNSWNWWGKPGINEQIVKETIDAMAASGLRDAGYTYVVVDGGWRETHLGPNGELLANAKFPHGIKYLADYAHAHGLKFGVHTTPGTHDCGGDRVGGYDHEEVHVRQFVEWGLDFVKVDRCKFESGWTEELLESRYRKWSDLLAHCGRDILFSISAYQYRPWYPGVCAMARTTGDIKARIHKGGAVFEATNRKGFLSVMTIAEINNEAAPFAGHGYWNDPDMLVTGEHGLTPEEQKAHFALWCIMSAPLMLGDDPRNLSAAEKEIILNRDAIAVDQDTTEQGRRLRKDGPVEVWIKHLAGGRAAVLLLNRDASAEHAITFRGEEAGLAGSFSARDVYARRDLGVSESSLTRTVGPRACSFLVVQPK